MSHQKRRLPVPKFGVPEMFSQRTKFGRRLGGKPKYYAGSYAARLPSIFGEPFDGRGASSGSSQRPATAPERIGGRRQTPTQPRSGSGVGERGRSTWVSGKASLDGSVLIGAIILAAAGVTVFVLGAIESLSPTNAPVNRGAMLMLVGGSFLMAPVAMCQAVFFSRRLAPVRFQPGVPNV
ncbi:hypothetical protein HPB51_005494 [Rhipicephalus microplus]|uniref:Uncharacterized protein n=1 Tax=Rhipicephalus microplus TaxID=6941 RepID=A0A9J6EZ27_RHIMP|nr:hypothetical protein HPB51_005494 [Rhipicephalus microplus]